MGPRLDTSMTVISIHPNRNQVLSSSGPGMKLNYIEMYTSQKSFRHHTVGVNPQDIESLAFLTLVASLPVK